MRSMVEGYYTLSKTPPPSFGRSPSPSKAQGGFLLCCSCCDILGIILDGPLTEQMTDRIAQFGPV
jgi:hypothetical protein